jgi:hypothetical protein
MKLLSISQPNMFQMSREWFSWVEVTAWFCMKFSNIQTCDMWQQQWLLY